MDRELLVEEIRKVTVVKVGLRYRAIMVNTKMALSADQLVKAIHVEVSDENFQRDRAKIEDLYKSDHSEGFPLGIKLRLCPPIQETMDPKSLTKLIGCRFVRRHFWRMW